MVISRTTYPPQGFIIDSIVPRIRIFESASVYYAMDNKGGIMGSNANIISLLNAIQPSINAGDTITFQTKNYAGTGIWIIDKPRLQILGNGSTIAGKFQMGIATTGQVADAEKGMIADFLFSGTGSGVILDNVFNPMLDHCYFKLCDAGITFASTNKWTEYYVLRNCHFEDCFRSLYFKAGSGNGTGSYINGSIETASFNQTNSVNAQGGIYKYIEIESNAEVAESDWTNLRFWFNSNIAQGIGIEHSGSATRCKLHQPFFENFAGPTQTIGIRYNASAISAFRFDGGPVFAGAGGWAGKFINNSNIHMHGPLVAWRQSHTITPSATADTFGSVVNCLTGEEYGDIPNIYVVIGGTVGGSETITVEIKAITFSATTPTVTKTYNATGTYPLGLADYQVFMQNDFYTMIDHFEVKAKSSGASTAATISFAGFNGGSALAKPINDDVYIRKDDANLITLQRLSASAVGTGIAFRLGTTGLGLNYANIYGHAITSSPLVGKITFQIANNSSPAERLAILEDGALLTQSYLNLTKISAPADPATEEGRTYFKTADTNNNGLFIKQKQLTAVAESQILDERIGAKKFSEKKWGIWSASANGGGDGMFSGGMTGIGSAAFISVYANGRGVSYTSAGASGDNAGFRYGASLVYRGWNPRLVIRFRLGQTTNERSWFGFQTSTGTDPTGDTELNSKTGFYVGHRSTDTNFVIMHNDGSATALYDNVTGSPPIDTNIHKIEIMADDANTRFRVSFDGGAWQDITAQIPAQQTIMTVVAQVEASAAEAKVIDLFYVQIEQDK